MHYHFRNVNDAFRTLVYEIDTGCLPTRRSPSRVGEVLMVEEPITITFSHPRERVLFNPARDANPFFHLFESLWMLAGRNDVAPLTYYNSKIAEIASDDGETFNGAYGYRWRHGVDQLKIIVDQLKRKPESRRVVLTMWTVGDDLLKIDVTKDVCCNTHAYFALRNGLLDMTVCNRSNDLVWGMLGANVVHFSYLQEYLAACIGVEVGNYHQITNNLHVYTERWTPEKWIRAIDVANYETGKGYDWAGEPFPLVQDPAMFDGEVQEFVNQSTQPSRRWSEPFLDRVAAPMCWAFQLHRRRDYPNAAKAVDLVAALDWRIAGAAWLDQRRESWKK